MVDGEDERVHGAVNANRITFAAKGRGMGIEVERQLHNPEAS